MSHMTETSTQHHCPACHFGPFARNHYFTGKLLVERDFKDEALFHIEKLRHHEQRLHGWGVVCGLKVKAHENPACRDRFVCIEAGTAVDCCGRDIVVREPECIDIRDLSAIRALESANDTQLHTLQICLRHRECPTEEIPVLYDECGCDETQCAPNRILESYDVDVLVDPKEEPNPIETPRLKWENTSGIAQAWRVALHEGSHRVYVVTERAPGIVYQVSTDNYATVSSHVLPADAVAIAVANDGSRLYVISGSPGSGTARLLHVLDTTRPGLPRISTQPLVLPNSASSKVHVAVAPAPDNRLYALVANSGDLLRWQPDIDSQANPAAPSVVKNLGVDLRTVALGTTGAHAYGLGPGSQLQVVDLATSAVNTITVLPAGTLPAGMAVVASAAGDRIAVVDQAKRRLYLVAANPPAVAGSVDLDYLPVAVAASSDGQWAYVIEHDVSGNYVQPVNVRRLQMGLAVQPGAPFRIGAPTLQGVVGQSGRRIYLPFSGDARQPALGGVAIVDVGEETCCEIPWRHLDGCPHCDQGNCVVIATIENYRVGYSFDDQTEPPADPAADANARMARINNRRGRRLLPSTQVLAEMLECLCARGGGGGVGPQGPQGPQGLQGEKGDKGDPGTAVALDLPHIVAINWQHNGVIPVPQVGPTINEHGLVIVFDKPMLAHTINPRAVELLVRVDLSNQLYVYANVAVKDVEAVRAFARVTPEENVTRCGQPIVRVRRVQAGESPNAARIIVDLTQLRLPGSSAPPTTDLTNRAEANQPPSSVPLFVGEYHVIVNGDLILGEQMITLPDGRRVNPALDANHLGPGLPQRCPTGNGTEGGQFRSWFRIELPVDQPEGPRLPGGIRRIPDLRRADEPGGIPPVRRELIP